MKFKTMTLQAAILVLGTGIGFSAHATEEALMEGVSDEAWDGSLSEASEAPQISRAYGPGMIWSAFHASKFVPKNGTPIPKYYGRGYIYPANTNFSEYWVQFDLPNGAKVEYVYIAYYDNDASGYVSFDLAGYEAGYGSSASPAYKSYGAPGYTISDTPGYSVVGLAPTSDMVVREFADMDGDGVSHLLGFGMTVYMNASTTGSDVRFFGAGVQWKRQIAPKPATASFGDVPTNYWAFQEIEALSDSGITAGCGTSGNFCPDDNVTRAQMAVFLARALGLHWGT